MPVPEAGAVTEAACDLAWFYVVTAPDPKLALDYARQAAGPQQATEDPVVQRVLGAAELQARQTEAGLRRLRPLVGTDAYAARLVADYYFDSRRPGWDPNVAWDAIKEGVKAGRSGPAFRQLAALARAHGEDIPPAPDANEGHRIYETSKINDYLEMPRDPNRYISVRLRPAKSAFLPGEAIAVEAALANDSNYEVPVGDWGLVNPRLGLTVKVRGILDPFKNLPVLSWPVPRQLPPGSTYTARANLAVGTLGRLLAQRPLENFDLEVSAALDPVQRGTRIDSSVPNLNVPILSLTRRALVDLQDANDPNQVARACSTQLGRIVYDLQSGSLPARLQAARQTAGLLALHRSAELGRTTLPKPVAEALPRGVLLRMVVEALKDPSDVVRAELLAALQLVSLDGRIVAHLGPAVEDASPLVRMRLVELLGASGLPGQKTILDYLAKDRDEAVRLMVAAFSPPKGRG
jgi:hypothetical protein